jgi:hypothetical protein
VSSAAGGLGGWQAPTRHEPGAAGGLNGDAATANLSFNTFQFLCVAIFKPAALHAVATAGLKIATLS